MIPCMKQTVVPRKGNNPDFPFARRLRELRGTAGLTQQELADRSGLSLPGIKQFEIGRREPAFQALLKLAHGLGVPLSAFDPEANEPAPKPAKKPRRRKPGRDD
jgi:transcriptional regulator with XRE-family HTH domain